MKDQKAKPNNGVKPYTVPQGILKTPGKRPALASSAVASSSVSTSPPSEFRNRVEFKSVVEENGEQARQSNITLNAIGSDVQTAHAAPKDPRISDGPAPMWDLAQGSNLDGNRTCFTNYQDLRSKLEERFSPAEGNYLARIHAAFDRYCELYPHTDNAAYGGPHLPRETTRCKEKKDINWSSSRFVEYLYFLFQYFLPRKMYGGNSDGSNSDVTGTFGLQNCGARDDTIEYLLSLCTGVVFRKKSISSHGQNSRNRIGGAKEIDPRRECPEYLSMAQGFEQDFPGQIDPWKGEETPIQNFCNERETLTPEERDAIGIKAGRLLALPSVLAVILKTVARPSKIEWSLTHNSFIFSDWLVPKGFTNRWDVRETKKDAAAQESVKVEVKARSQAKADKIVSSSKATGFSKKTQSGPKGKKWTATPDDSDGHGSGSGVSEDLADTSYLLPPLQLELNGGQFSLYGAAAAATARPATFDREALRRHEQEEIHRAATILCNFARTVREREASRSSGSSPAHRSDNVLLQMESLRMTQLAQD